MPQVPSFFSQVNLVHKNSKEWALVLEKTLTLEFIAFHKRNFQELGSKRKRILKLARSRQPNIKSVLLAEFILVQC